MARIVFGLGSQSITFNVGAGTARAVESVMISERVANRLQFFRAPGNVRDEETETITLLVSPSSQIGFFYEGAHIPELDEDLADGMKELIRVTGGLSLGYSGIPSESMAEFRAMKE